MACKDSNVLVFKRMRMQNKNNLCDDSVQA